MIHAGKHLRELGGSGVCMEEVVGSMVDFLYDSFCGKTSGVRCNALVRCFKTHSFGALPKDLQALVRRHGADQSPHDSMRCLILMASRGEEPAWNSRYGSTNHRVIPLPTARVLRDAPMVSEMIRQMGLEAAQVVGSPANILVDFKQRSFNVFHVEQALGSEYLPAQESFVIRHKIRSVLGVGGLLPSGELFVVLMFSRVWITLETAAMFRTLALSVKLLLLPFSGGRVFVNE
jgi:two-component system NtrC family sensor kinase